MVKILINIIILFSFSFVFANDLKEGSLKEPQKIAVLNLNFDFIYEQIPLSARVYEFNDDGGNNATVGSFGLALSRNRLSVGNEITNNSYLLPKGSVRKVIMTIENNTNNTYYFYMSPTEFIPGQNSLGVSMLWGKEGVFYKIPPKKTWYMVGVIIVNADSLGDKIKFRQGIIGIDLKEFQDNLKRNTVK